MADLTQKTCTPCQGGVPPLTAAEAGSMRKNTPKWQLLDESKRIERTYDFRNFRDAYGFVQGVSDLSEEEGHHPDITFGWGYATISLQTKKIMGLHENDFILAAKIDRLAEKAPVKAA